MNPLFLPQNQKRYKIKKTLFTNIVPIQNSTPLNKTESNAEQQTFSPAFEVLPSVVPPQKLFKVMHMIDCIYQGEVSSSYARQGFGMQQTNSFHTSIGFWKRGKLNGIAMLIYPEEGIIYGNFKDNNIQGIAIVDDKRKLKVGIFELIEDAISIVDIGYQYLYESNTWKMCKYHKGYAIETHSIVTQPIQEGIPSILNLNQNMLQLLNQYLSQEYFDIPSQHKLQKKYQYYTQMNHHKLQNNLRYFGQKIQGKQWGLGVVYAKTQGKLIEAGFYENGLLHGYAIKFIRDKLKVEIGLYNRGRKQGFFYQKTNKIEVICEYKMNFREGERPQIKKSKIENNQKIHNYQKKDFYSEKNQITFNNYLNIFQNPNIKKKTKKKEQNHIQTSLNQLKSKKLRNKSFSINVIPKSSTDNVKDDKIASNQNTKLKSPTQESTFQKSSVEVIKNKLFDIQNIIRMSKNQIKEQERTGDARSGKSREECRQRKKSIHILKKHPSVTDSDDDGLVQTEDRPIYHKHDRVDSFKNRRGTANDSEFNISELTSDNNLQTYLKKRSLKKGGIWSPYKSRRKTSISQDKIPTTTFDLEDNPNLLNPLQIQKDEYSSSQNQFKNNLRVELGRSAITTTKRKNKIF